MKGAATRRTGRGADTAACGYGSRLSARSGNARALPSLLGRDDTDSLRDTYAAAAASFFGGKRP